MHSAIHEPKQAREPLGARLQCCHCLRRVVVHKSLPRLNRREGVKTRKECAKHHASAYENADDA